MNSIVVEGAVTNDIWTYGGDTLFRIRHDDGGDHFTVRFRNLPLDIKPGTRVVISGRLISRDQRVSLEDFVSRATRGDGGPDEKLLEKIKGLAQGLEPVNRSYTEILAQEIRMIR